MCIAIALISACMYNKGAMSDNDNGTGGEEDTTSAKTCTSHIGHALQLEATGRVPRVWRESCTHSFTTMKLGFGVHSIVHIKHQHFCCLSMRKVHSKKVKLLWLVKAWKKKTKKAVIKRSWRKCALCVWLLDTNFLFTCTTSTISTDVHLHWHWLTC